MSGEMALVVTGLVQTFNLFLAGYILKNLGELWRDFRDHEKNRDLHL